MIKKILLAIILIALVPSISFAKNDKDDKDLHLVGNRPKLVVGMVVDQMTWEYLYRYQKRFGKGGFMRLLNDGFNCDNTIINYLPSVTAIGHTSAYTGSVPALHGITGNDFYINNKAYYCTQDDNEKSVGAKESKAGRMSPRNLVATTITDELKLATAMRSKVISVSLKDRGAILPGGHLSDGSYWFDDKAGKFITSTYYRKDLPEWLDKFNAKNLVDKYLNEGWDTLYPEDTYINSTSDLNEWEEPWGKVADATLPLDTKKLKEAFGYGVIRSIPMGNTLTLELAKAALKGEKLGSRKGETDFLAISLSSTDYIGHRYGVDAIETEDCYLRLDKDLADFFNTLDKEIGKNEYLFFITADHAASHNVTYLMDKKVHSGAWRYDIARKTVDSVANAMYPNSKDLILGMKNYQVYLNSDVVVRDNIDKNKLLSTMIYELKKIKGVYRVIQMDRLSPTIINNDLRDRLQNTYYEGRSGDLFILLEPAHYGSSVDRPKGTSHGVWAPFDTHIPLIFMGKNIPSKHLHRRVNMTDISATLAQWLNIQMPNACIGEPITEMWED